MGQQRQPTAYGKQLVALGRTLQSLREENNIDVLIETTIAYLQEEFDYPLIWIGLYDRLDHRMLGKGGVSPKGNRQFITQRFNLNPGDLLEQVVIQQKPLGVPDLREEMRAGEWRRIAQQIDIQGTIIFPLRYKDRCFGVTLLGSPLWGISPQSDEKARLSILLGGLAAALYHIEVQWQHQQTKRPHEPLLALMSQLRGLDTLDRRLEAIVEQTQQFLTPSRTNVYWFERERRYFWRRASNRTKTVGLVDSKQSSSGIVVGEVSGFYQALLGDRVVAIGEAYSSLKADATDRLMQQIKARSLLAAPILFQDELLGFLAVEGTQARIWQEEEKKYLRGAAQLVALTAPLAEMERTIEQTKLDQTLTSGLTRAITSDDDWKATLKLCAEQLCQRLHVERFFVLLYNRDLDAFEVAYQNQPAKRRTIASPLPRLSQLEWQAIEQSRGAIALENWAEDERFTAWRPIFLEAGVRSLLACNTAFGHPPEGILAVGYESTRTWNRSECEIVQITSQQIGLILHQWQLQRQNDAQQQLVKTLQWGLKALQQSESSDEGDGRRAIARIETATVEELAHLIRVPLVAFIAWTVGQSNARVTATVQNDPFFNINPDASIPVRTDGFVRQTLSRRDRVGPVTFEQLPEATRHWLVAPEGSQILAIALHTAPEHQPTGILLVADRPNRYWSQQHFDRLDLMAAQLAWLRRTSMLTARLHAVRERLQQLHWYKHRRLEDFYRMVGSGVKQLMDLGEVANAKASPEQQALQHTRYQQIIRQLGHATASVSKLLQQEQWRLRNLEETIPMAGWLKRAIERVDPLVKQRQLWLQVHREGNGTLQGDRVKLELILYEVLVAACYRCDKGGRIDVWCRVLDNQKLEVSLTDNGKLAPRLMRDLQTSNRPDLLAPSPCDRPPDLYLAICQQLMRHMGGDFMLYTLEDGRNVSRLLLPLNRRNSGN